MCIYSEYISGESNVQFLVDFWPQNCVYEIRDLTHYWLSILHHPPLNSFRTSPIQLLMIVI